ncbi:polysaccharide deacetylase family protein [Bacillus sp. sid0103]|uniref:polysaccharide deacetylase family protein n=1 Tax=Bacillus sp. sid0103 TaxID=2856337 RepID=UPI001C456016|nr:polysaccharide deacetylase family protein [Bacillus sp. sid0103]MBV7505572.1 polysaccharide deacetylase family protein [Bacillus sp. sid0103]
MKSDKHGTFIISLDFELFWGVHDVYKKEQYEQNIRGAHNVVLSLLDMFTQYQIHATWAIVGMIYCKNIEELASFVPVQKPAYYNKKLSSYHYFENNPIDEKDKDLFFAPYLIKRIAATPDQEIATHTFSHYYCLEEGQTIEQFSADLHLAQQISLQQGREIKSIVFPRNQINVNYIKECKRLGIRAYRGNEDRWVYRLQSTEKKRYMKRALRLLDRYINIFGHQTFELPQQSSDDLPLNIPSSRYLARCSDRLKWLEGMRLKRILSDMTCAAQQGKSYHLWWHPHDFGRNTCENLAFLEKILEHFLHLQKTYGFRSRNMNELALEITHEKEERNEYKMEETVF